MADVIQELRDAIATMNKVVQEVRQDVNKVHQDVQALRATVKANSDKVDKAMADTADMVKASVDVAMADLHEQLEALQQSGSIEPAARPWVVAILEDISRRVRSLTGLQRVSDHVERVCKW